MHNARHLILLKNKGGVQGERSSPSLGEIVACPKVGTNEGEKRINALNYLEN